MPVTLEESRKAILDITDPKHHSLINKLYDHPDRMTPKESATVTEIIEHINTTRIEPIRKVVDKLPKVSMEHCLTSLLTVRSSSPSTAFRSGEPTPTWSDGRNGRETTVFHQDVVEICLEMGLCSVSGRSFNLRYIGSIKQCIMTS